jgi:sec-independent protein translocase protein TatB
MLDMSWGEVLVIGAVALIVIGPKDLPKALRTVGNMTAKMRKMASEFQGQFNEAMREAELDEIRKQVSGLNESVTAFNPIETARNELKSAIEQTPSTNEGASAALPESRDDAASPAAIEGPAVAVPVASLPPVADPARSVADAVEHDARVEPAGAEPAREPAPEGTRA